MTVSQKTLTRLYFIRQKENSQLAPTVFFDEFLAKKYVG